MPAEQNRKAQIKQAFDNFTKEYDKFMLDTGHTNARNQILEKLQGEISGKVLDVATGTGDVVVWIAKNTNAAEIDGTDLSENLILKAVEKVEKEQLRISFSVKDTENLQYPNKTFDTITCCLGVCWFVDRKKALSEMTRVCKDEGKIIFLEERAFVEKDGIMAVQKVTEETRGEDEKVKVFAELVDDVTTDYIKEVMSGLEFSLVKETEIVAVDENHGMLGMVFEKINPNPLSSTGS